MKAGKAVYCEKPMVRLVDEGPGVIAAEKETGAVFQVGSQYASSLIYDKVRELIKDGAIGAINSVEARYNRNSPIGAWQYTLPPDASPETIDWDRFLGTAPKHPFDAVRFFRWRNYSRLRHGRRGRPLRSPAHGDPSRRRARSAQPGSPAWAASDTGRTAATSTT